MHISAKLHCPRSDRNFKFHLCPESRLRIYIFVPTAWLLSLWQHNVITLPRVTACCCDEAKTSETVLHLCTFFPKPHFDLESDYVVRKPMKHRFQRYIVRTEILSTSQARVEYISGEQYVIPLLKTGLSAYRQTDTQKWKQYILQFHSVHLADI